MEPKTETKSRSLRTVIDFMNAEFTRSGKQDREAAYLLKLGLSLKRARAIQETLHAAHRSGDVTPLAEGVRDYADAVEWVPSKDRRGFRMLWDISRAESILYVAIVNVVNGGQFLSLKQCPECWRFFPRKRKRKYCSGICVRSHESKTAQQRTERARRIRRFQEISPKLVRLQELAQSMPFSEMLGRLPGFDAKLLAAIIEGKPLKELVLQVKYRNRKILMQAKI